MQQLEMNQIHLGDCLELADGIESGSVDLIVTDPPYGTMNGINGITWDFAIDPVKLFEIANRILRNGGRLVLFSQEPYTSRLITQASAGVPFLYRLIWEKDNFGNPLSCNKAPVGYFEDILVFGKTSPKHDFEGLHPLRPYFADVLAYIGKTKRDIIKTIGGRVDHVLRTNSSQFSLCTRDTYSDIIDAYSVDRMPGFKPFDELQAIDAGYVPEAVTKFPSVFNLWQGQKYKSNILRYKKDYNGYHPTQKPTLLLEDILQTYSNPGDKVVDLTAGSGSLAIAAINTGRNFLCIEMDEGYHQIATQRVRERVAALSPYEYAQEDQQLAGVL